MLLQQQDFLISFKETENRDLHLFFPELELSQKK